MDIGKKYFVSVEIIKVSEWQQVALEKTFL